MRAGAWYHYTCSHSNCPLNIVFLQQHVFSINECPNGSNITQTALMAELCFVRFCPISARSLMVYSFHPKHAEKTGIPKWPSPPLEQGSRCKHKMLCLGGNQVALLQFGWFSLKTGNLLLSGTNFQLCEPKGNNKQESHPEERIRKQANWNNNKRWFLREVRGPQRIRKPSEVSPCPQQCRSHCLNLKVFYLRAAKCDSLTAKSRIRYFVPAKLCVLRLQIQKSLRNAAKNVIFGLFLCISAWNNNSRLRLFHASITAIFLSKK